MNIDTKKLIQTKFLAFTMKAFATLNKGKRLGNDKYLKLLAERLARVAAGKTKRLVVSLPPRHFKTFMGSICLPAWILAHNPSAKIIILTYGQELADKIAYAVRAILQSDWFEQAFRTRLAKNRTKVMDFLTTDGGGVRSLSIEGGVTGLGADFIIIDDPVEIKDSDNAKRLERVNDLFDGEIQTRLDHPKKGCIIVIAHRISENDLPAHVLKKGGWQHLKLPLIAPRRRKHELESGEVWKRKKGELLRPDAFTKRAIRRLRDDSKRPGFETLQQQNPGGSDCLRIKAKYFPSFSPAELQMRELPVVLSIDPGQIGGPKNSFTVIQAWCPKDGVHLLLDQWREQATHGESRSAMWRFIRKYRPSVVLIEATGHGPALNSDIKPQKGMELVPITPSDDKVERLDKHRRTIRRGLVQLAQGASWYGEFIREATEFPYGSFDDQMDALSQYLTWIAEHPNPPPRPPMALIQRAGSQGRSGGTSASGVSGKAKGCVVVRRTRRWR